MTWISYPDDSTTVLTYAFQTNPAPLTSSTAGEEPQLGALEIVITNNTTAAVDLTKWSVNIPAGSGVALMQTTEDVQTAVSGDSTWTFTGPSSPVSSGEATFTLLGPSPALAAGASLSLQIFNFPTALQPGTSTLSYVETIGGGTPSGGSVEVTTFPAGFYFNGLAANVSTGSGLTPVAQVANGTPIVLTWNLSVVDVTQVTIYYTDAVDGQQTATASQPDSWTTPSGVTSDTVFTVVVSGNDPTGDPLPPVSLSTSVSVQNPDLVANSLSATTVSATTVTATTIDATGTSSAPGTANIGTATIETANITTATVSGTLTVTDTLTANGAVNASSLTVTGDTSLAAASIGGSLGALAPAQQLSQGYGSSSYTASTDGFVIGTVSGTAGFPSYAIIGATNSSGVVMSSMTGNAGSMPPVALTGNLCLPIRRNETFTTSAYAEFSQIQFFNPTFWFIPFGAGSASPSTLAADQAAALDAVMKPVNPST